MRTGTPLLRSAAKYHCVRELRRGYQYRRRLAPSPPIVSKVFMLDLSSALTPSFSRARKRERSGRCRAATSCWTAALSGLQRPIFRPEFDRQGRRVRTSSTPRLPHVGSIAELSPLRQCRSLEEVQLRIGGPSASADNRNFGNLYCACHTKYMQGKRLIKSASSDLPRKPPRNRPEFRQIRF